MNIDWLDRNEYPFQSRFLALDGYHLHYVDEGAGETLLFVHGTPSWSFDFRNIIRRLSDRYRCIAVDHMGFGLSDKPETYDYAAQAHAARLEQLILHLGLKRITLVAHDFGGPIGLSVALKRPGLFQKLVIMNSWLWSSEGDPGFIKISRVLKSPLLPFLYRYFNFSPRFLLPRSFGEHKLPARLLTQYTKPFAKRYQREGPLAFARSLLNDQDWFESLWQQRHLLSDKPLLLVWGMKDPVIGAAQLEKFLEGFPAAQVLRLQGSGHFPQEEEPAAVADAIAGFMLAKYPCAVS